MKMQEYVAVKIMPDKKGTSYNLEVVTDADFVNVVRCKDCKYAYMTDDGYCNWCDIMADLLGLEYDDIHLPGDWFCADGKKVMDNEQTN